MSGDTRKNGVRKHGTYLATPLEQKKKKKKKDRPPVGARAMTTGPVTQRWTCWLTDVGSF